MKTEKLTNANVFATDFSAEQRRAALARMHKVPLKIINKKGVGKPQSVWMRDVSASDSRSVKAWLNGRGDGRVFLWNLRVSLGLATEQCVVDNVETTEAVSKETPLRRVMMLVRRILSAAQGGAVQA